MSMRIDQKLPLSGGEYVFRCIDFCFRMGKMGGNHMSDPTYAANQRVLKP